MLPEVQSPKHATYKEKNRKHDQEGWTPAAQLMLRLAQLQNSSCLRVRRRRVRAPERVMRLLRACKANHSTHTRNTRDLAILALELYLLIFAK